jgi:putative CocE/NonD family hydrolase
MVGAIYRNHQIFGNYEPPRPKHKGYSDYSTYIKMRDGVKIAADFALPIGLTSESKIPSLLTQTRYWRAMELRAPAKWIVKSNELNPYRQGWTDFFTSHGYALVDIDVRGTGASFGVCPYPWPLDSIEDAREIVEWIIDQPWSNGKVAGCGISYLGTTAELLTILNHPAVKAVIPRFNHPDGYVDIAFPGGVFNQRFIEAWGYFDYLLDRNIIPKEFGLTGKIFVKGVKPVRSNNKQNLTKKAVDDHQQNGTVYMLARDVVFRDEIHPDIGICLDDFSIHRFKDKIKNSKTAIFSWGSWLDAGTADAVIRRFLSNENASRAVIGAWEHGGRFHASPFQSPLLPSDPPLESQWVEMLRFFDSHLKDDDIRSQDDKLMYYYTMGKEQWNTTRIWPPKGTTKQRMYLSENGELLKEPPRSQSGSDTYKVDFKATTGKFNRWWSLSGVSNQTVSYPNRRDADKLLLTFTSPPLKENIEITGNAVIKLYASSTHSDCAFYVYLEEVDKNGNVTYITEGQLRSIHHKISSDSPPYKLLTPYHSFKKDDYLPLKPGEITEIEFGLLATSVEIKKGHRIRIAIAGHDEDTFIRIPSEGYPEFNIFRNSSHASYVELPVISTKQ